jgi:DNA-binding Xre family transcriptional regulator
MIRLRIKEVAQQKSISMTRLSQRSEISYNTIKTFFRDPYRPISTDVLVRIARVLGVPPLELLEDVPDGQPPLRPTS